MKNYKFRVIKATIMLLVGILLIGLTACGGVEDSPEARLMSIFRVDGENVEVSREEATTIALAGTRLHQGYGVATGNDSFCYIQLDAYSLVKMDLMSRISIDRATDRLLSITLESGQILVDVQNQDHEHELYVLRGNLAIGVRGTLFIVGEYSDGDAIVIMLEGVVYANGTVLRAGYVMRVLDGIELEFVIEPINIEELDGFALSAILDNWERVLEAGVVTVEDLDRFSFMIEGEQIIEDVTDYIDEEDQDFEDIPAYITIRGEQFSTDLTILDLRGRGLTNEDILPLRYMVNLTHLFLNENQISDLSPLGELINLQRLVLSQNQIGNIGAIESLTNLEGLFLFQNQVSNLSALAGLTSLTELNLINNQISEISHLSGLTSLTQLSLSVNQINDISPLQGLTNLNELMISNNQISDISPLAGLANLRSLHASVNYISDWSPVAHVAELTYQFQHGQY